MDYSTGRHSLNENPISLKKERGKSLGVSTCKKRDILVTALFGKHPLAKKKIGLFSQEGEDVNPLQASAAPLEGIPHALVAEQPRKKKTKQPRRREKCSFEGPRLGAPSELLGKEDDP